MLFAFHPAARARLCSWHLQMLSFVTLLRSLELSIYFQLYLSRPGFLNMTPNVVAFHGALEGGYCTILVYEPVYISEKLATAYENKQQE